MTALAQALATAIRQMRGTIGGRPSVHAAEYADGGFLISVDTQGLQVGCTLTASEAERLGRFLLKVDGE